jgi:NADPH:quinone reductase-like Zn-dependent oxidoreductase
MKYRQIVVTRFDGPEVLQDVEEELPEPGPGGVRIRVLAAGVSYADLLMRERKIKNVVRHSTELFGLAGRWNPRSRGAAVTRTAESDMSIARSLVVTI